MIDLNLVVLVGRVRGSVKRYDDGAGKVVFTVSRGKEAFYVEGVGPYRIREAAGLRNGDNVLVVGELFSRRRRGSGRNETGVRAEQIIPLSGLQGVEPTLRMITSILEERKGNRHINRSHDRTSGGMCQELTGAVS